jgi:Mg2+-importing ATPase
MSNPEKSSKIQDNHTRRLYRAAQKKPDELFATYKSSFKGLSQKEVQERLNLFGKNNSFDHREPSSFSIFMQSLKNPINYLIFGLSIVSYISGSKNVGIFMILIIALSVFLKFIQEKRFNKLVHRLLKITQINVTVIRNYPFGETRKYQLPNFNHEIPISEIVPGDIIRISAGDIIPADIRLLSSKNLLVNQSVLTGETVPIDKDSEYDDAVLKSLPDLKNICFFGSCVVSGAGIGIAVHTGRDVYVHSISSGYRSRNKTNFDSGSQDFVMRTLKFMMYIIPLIFILSMLFKGNWSDSLLFAITVVLSLTPKSLPLTISTNLTRSSLLILKKNLIVKHITSIQSLASMTVLCMDKTGTLTEDLTVCEGAFNTLDKSDLEVLNYAYLNSYYQTGLKNHLDFALEKYVSEINIQNGKDKFEFLDELAFDSYRKRSSVLLKPNKGPPILICKGALEDILPLCTAIQNDPNQSELARDKSGSYITMTQRINELGLQAIAVGYKVFPLDRRNCQLDDEKDLTLFGYVTFMNPPVKEDIATLIGELKKYGVGVKIMTGDNHWDAMKVAKKVGLEFDKILLGNQIDGLNETQMVEAVKRASIFAKLSPTHKQKVIFALQEAGHIVGFLGDGINDIPAFFASDVGISVHNAVSAAKESSDVILMEKNTLVLIEAILEGRRAFLNINKYLKVGAITKFGTTVTIVASSMLFTFLPLHPIQILIQNTIFSLSQAGMPFDQIPIDRIMKPSQWEFEDISRLRVFFGPILTFFDVITFSILWFYFNARTVQTQHLFQTAWLVESVIMQAMVLHLFRSTAFDFKKLSPSFLTTMLSFIVVLYVPFSPLAKKLGFIPLPNVYFIWVLFMMIFYVFSIQLFKFLFEKRYHYVPKI